MRHDTVTVSCDPDVCLVKIVYVMLHLEVTTNPTVKMHMGSMHKTVVATISFSISSHMQSAACCFIETPQHRGTLHSG